MPLRQLSLKKKIVYSIKDKYMDSGFPGIKAGSAADRQIDYDLSMRRNQESSKKIDRLEGEIRRLQRLLRMVVTDVCARSGGFTEPTALELYKYNKEHEIFT